MTLRAGAVNFLEKPVHTGELWHAIEEAIDLDRRRRQVWAWRKKLADRFESLTPKERVVLRLIGEAKGTKDIASALEVSVRVVQKHRASLIRKLEVSSLGDLVDIGLHAAMPGALDGSPAPWPGPQGHGSV